MISNTLHVMPNSDLIQHCSNDECVCVPTPTAVGRRDGSVGWVMVHHSLDGRELHE